MTFIEFAEKVLGIELLDWQKSVLEIAQEHKDDGKRFYIDTYSRQGKMLLNNVIRQKLGYDRGCEDGAREFAEWLVRKNGYLDLFGNDSNKLLTEWQKENKDVTPDNDSMHVDTIVSVKFKELINHCSHMGVRYCEDSHCEVESFCKKSGLERKLCIPDNCPLIYRGSEVEYEN